MNYAPISWDTGNNDICNFSTEIICELQHPGLVRGAGVKNVKTLGEDYVHCVPIIVHRLPSHAESSRLQKQYSTCEGRLQRDYSPGGDDSVWEPRLNQSACSLPLTKGLHGNTTMAAIAWPLSAKLNLCFAYQKENLNYHKKKIPSGLVEVSNSFDIVFGLFSALFPSDFIWKKNTLFSWPMRTEGHLKDVQQCSNDLETQHWNGSNLIGSVSHGPDERHLFENHLAINGAWIGVFPSIVLEQFVDRNKTLFDLNLWRNPARKNPCKKQKETWPWINAMSRQKEVWLKQEMVADFAASSCLSHLSKAPCHWFLGDNYLEYVPKVVLWGLLEVRKSSAENWPQHYQFMNL